MDIHDMSPLFESVQMGHIFPDSKTFPDCLPKSNPKAILAQYLSEKDRPGFNLKAFVLAHFDLPSGPAGAGHHNANRPLREHLEALWDELTREPGAGGSSLIELPFPFVVPGGRFREIYYWDSYFTMLGLRVSGRTDLIRCMVDNFEYLIRTLGHIPNGNRSYYISRSQPPYFSLMVRLLAEALDDRRILLQYARALESEYNFWMRGHDQLHAGAPALHRVVLLPDGVFLNRYWDELDTPRPEAYHEDVALAAEAGSPGPGFYRHIRAAAESGWDFSQRWFRDPERFASIHTTDFLPVDLNCLLWHLEDTLSEAAALAAQPERAAHYAKLAETRKSAIEKYCWNNHAGCYFDYDFLAGQNTPTYTLAAVSPLFFGLSDAQKAASVAQMLEEKMLQIGGLVTTLVRSGQQWDAPNGWAPLQWLAYKGVQRYGHNDLAAEIRKRWLASNRLVYAASGKMTEKYDVLAEDRAAGGGEYPNQDGFGWTNGVYLAMAAEENS